MSYPLTTARLRIEPLQERDVRDFTAYRQDPEVARYQSWDVTYGEQDATRLVAGQPDGDVPPEGRWLQLAVRSAETGRLLGDVAVHTLADQPDTYELGVTLARTSQGSGFATEALNALLAHLFRAASAHRVVAFCDSRNDAVFRTLRRVGMRHESRAVEGDYSKGEWTTLDGFAILAREYPDA